MFSSFGDKDNFIKNHLLVRGNKWRFGVFIYQEDLKVEYFKEYSTIIYQFLIESKKQTIPKDTVVTQNTRMIFEWDGYKFFVTIEYYPNLGTIIEISSLEVIRELLKIILDNNIVTHLC
jgi:hypothetical protein